MRPTCRSDLALPFSRTAVAVAVMTLPSLGPPGREASRRDRTRCQGRGGASPVPKFPAGVARRLTLQGGRAAHDLRDLLGDRRLTLAVVGPVEQVEHLARVVGRVLHGGALGPVEGEIG